MNAPTPFKAELFNGRIILSGDLDRSPAIRQECERIAKLAAQTGSRFVVDAQRAKLWVGGEKAWSEVAQEFLGRCQLIYLPSPLAQNLEYDDQYRHGKSRFLETDDELVGCGSSTCSATWEQPARRAAAAC
jgi:hypothetical protein